MGSNHGENNGQKYRETLPLKEQYQNVGASFSLLEDNFYALLQFLPYSTIIYEKGVQS